MTNPDRQIEQVITTEIRSWKMDAAELSRKLIDQRLLDILDNIELAQTCRACPEQYEAFYKGGEVGYFRLRGGWYYVSYPSSGGKIVYESSDVKGDGIFEEHERDRFLHLGKLAIAEEIFKDNLRKQSGGTDE